jgi:hypothetical protein
VRFSRNGASKLLAFPESLRPRAQTQGAQFYGHWHCGCPSAQLHAKIATYRSLVVSGTGAGIYEGTNFRSIGPRANKFAINIFCFWSKQQRFNRDVEGGHSL